MLTACWRSSGHRKVGLACNGCEKKQNGGCCHTYAAAAKIPMVLRNDRQAIQAAIKLCLIGDPRKVRLARIRNTLSLEHMSISETLVAEAGTNPRIKVVGHAADMAFNAEGNLR